jgi:hypothetical protein
MVDADPFFQNMRSHLRNLSLWSLVAGLYIMNIVPAAGDPGSQDMCLFRRIDYSQPGKQCQHGLPRAVFLPEILSRPLNEPFPPEK